MTASSPAAQLGAILVDGGLVTPDDLDRAIVEQRRLGRSLGRVLVDLGIVSESALVEALAMHLGMEFVDLSERLIPPNVAELVPTALAQRHSLVPVEIDATGRLVVAMADPSNVLALDDVRTVAELDVVPVVATRPDIATAITRFLHGGAVDEDLSYELDVADDDDDLEQLTEITDDAPIVKFVNSLILAGVRDRASDIHIEPTEVDVRVRYRVDGVLHETMRQPRKIHSAVVSRLKIMADLDIAERRVPQDGRIQMKKSGVAVDLRVSTLPTVHGEKVVMRILDKSAIMLELTDLGFLESNAARYAESYRKPYGMILVTGPTGSGKSTTLYATLNVLNDPAINIVTTEDPVEYRLAGINQVQINPKAGLTFPRALRSILRQDPDVVLVGEMRDHETAHIGMEAALTGHLVLSTLHTNDAPSAVTRLAEMGIDPFLVASSVDCVLAQRLARRLCTRCCEPYQPTREELSSAGLVILDDAEIPTINRAVGCGQCAHTGYRGRLAVHEVMTVTEQVERMIVERASTDEIAKMAQSQGMSTLREDGLAKVLLGQTTLEEISRVVA